MAIHTQQSLSGFIASDPQLSFTSKGDARFYAKVGQEHYRREEDGSFTQLETTFHDLAHYRKAAERSYAVFVKGDKYIAEGYVREYDHEVDGHTQHGEEFVAKKIGHDAARTTYSVDRSRQAHSAAGRDQGADAAGHESIDDEAGRRESVADDRSLTSYQLLASDRGRASGPALAL